MELEVVNEMDAEEKAAWDEVQAIVCRAEKQSRADNSVDYRLISHSQPDPLIRTYLHVVQDPTVGDEPFNICGYPIPDVKAYRLGIVRGGQYDGRSLEMATVAQPAMGTAWESYYYLSDYYLSDPSHQSIPVLLEFARATSDFGPSTGNGSSSEMLGQNGRMAKLTNFLLDPTVSIPDFELEQTLFDMNNRVFRFTGYWLRIDAVQSAGLETAEGVARLPGDGRYLYLYNQLNSEGSPVVPEATSIGSTQFYMVDEDGRTLWYELEIPFWNYGGSNRFVPNPPTIKWNDGLINSTVYLKGKVGGCGFTSATNVVTQKQMSELPVMVRVGTGLGTNASETPIFEPSTYDHSYYTEGFNALAPQFASQGEGVKKSFTDFSHPFVYFQDSFGRWIELMSNEVVPPVECGKPVIYLYPEKSTNLTVEIAPKGGFSYTEPEYGDGWEVTAYPDGRLVNQADGLEYPYLFWEGRGGVYAPPTQYWVVEQPSVESFLRSTLAQMNFNQTEIDDFVEFWLPRMQKDAYYKISFHDTRVMNELAPLSLSVKPDHLFRILMDYEGLVSWQPSKPPIRLPRANRDGFEVMEWGGVLR